jgi:glyoxylase-like metal-dependent hydrolase (beta-lactamase superfamily II)
MRLASLLLGLCISCTTTAPSSPHTAQAGFYRTRVGATEVTVVSDGTFSLDVAHGLALDARPGEIESALALASQASPIDASFNEFVFTTNGHVVLIDAGAATNMGPTAGKLQVSLRNAGVRAEDVTDVFLTHIHPDHAGGLSNGGKRAFPNATIHVDANDLAYWMDPHRAADATGMAAMFFATARTALEPYVAANKVKTFTGATDFFPGFRAEPAYGHTPGHVTYTLESQGKKLVFLGDLVHIPMVQFADPEVAVAFDVDPAAAVATRRRVLGEVADKDVLIAHDHVAFPGLGHVRRDGTGFRWIPAPYVNDEAMP